jgi:hypothetical protein
MKFILFRAAPFFLPIADTETSLSFCRRCFGFATGHLGWETDPSLGDGLSTRFLAITDPSSHRYFVYISNVAAAAWCMREGELIEIGCYSMVVALCYVHLNDHRHSRRQMRAIFSTVALADGRGRTRSPAPKDCWLCALPCVY